MAYLLSGLNFSTESKEGVALNICTTVNTTANPEYPAQPFPFGTFTYGLDDSKWIFCEPASNYAIGTVGYIDTSWKFTAITTANATLSGMMVGVMSQVASVTVTPTSTLYDGLWVQVGGGCPAIQGAASTSANAQLYTTTTAGQITSTSGGGNVALNGMILTTAVGSGAAATAVGLLNDPEILLTT